MKNRRWFSWLVRFRGLSAKGSDEELGSISIDDLDDPSRTSKHGGLDSTWTTDLMLNLMSTDLKGKQRLSMKTIGQDRDVWNPPLSPPMCFTVQFTV